MSASETTEEKIARLMEEQEMLALQTRKLQVDQEIRGLKRKQQQQHTIEAKKVKEVEEQEEQEVTFVSYGSLKREHEPTPPKQQRALEGKKINIVEEQEELEVTFLGYGSIKRERGTTTPKQPSKIEHGLPNVAANPAWDTNDKASEASPSKRSRITGSEAKSPATLAQNAIAEQSIAVPLPKRTKKPSIYDPVSDDPEYRTIIKSVTGDEYVQLACCFCGGNCSQRVRKPNKYHPWIPFKGAFGLLCHINICHESQMVEKMSVEDTASRCVVHVLTPQEKKAVDDKNQYLFSVEPKHAATAEAGSRVKAKRPPKHTAQDVALA